MSRQGLPPVSTSEDVSSARWNFAHAGLFDAAIVVQHDRERERGRQRHRESAIKLCGGYRTRAALRSARVRHDSPVVSPHRVSRQGLPPVSTSEDVSSARWKLRARRLVRRSYRIESKRTQNTGKRKSLKMLENTQTGKLNHIQCIKMRVSLSLRTRVGDIKSGK